MSDQPSEEEPSRDSESGESDGSSEQERADEIADILLGNLGREDLGKDNEFQVDDPGLYGEDIEPPELNEDGSLKYPNGKKSTPRGVGKG